MDKCGEEFSVDKIATSTWLNSYPRWLELFPLEWMANMGPHMTDIKNGFGWWGQFVNARGAFNHKHAQRFRETGQLPFLPRRSWCSFESLRKHLNEHLRKLS